jgi:hypothetical protein
VIKHGITKWRKVLFADERGSGSLIRKKRGDESKSGAHGYDVMAEKCSE